MVEIKGKTLFFTDLHLGLSSNKTTKLNIAINVIKDIIKYVKANKINNIIFCGDWHHNRNNLENNTLNVSYKLAKALSKYANFYMILGNHDLYYKNSVDVNSINIFESIENINIVRSSTEANINDRKCLFAPWLADLSTFEKETFDMIVGHFEVSSKYLIKSYVEDHSSTNKTSDLISKLIDNDNIISDVGKSGQSLEETVDEAVKINSKAGDLVGNFVELAKKNGLIFSGHIHGRREFLAKGRKFVFVGSPYQQNKGEIGNRCGFYILNEDFSYEFHEINSPKHVLIKTSEVLKDGIDNFDFSIVKNNIVQRIYDKELDKQTEAKFQQKITDFKPYEEMMPEYQVSLDSLNSTIDFETGETANLIQKSKLEYVKNYIDNIDEKALKEQNIEKEKLYNILENYYNSVVEA